MNKTKILNAARKLVKNKKTVTFSAEMHNVGGRRLLVYGRGDIAGAFDRWNNG